VTELIIVIGKTVDDKYYFRVRIDNGRVLFTSREYVHIEKCMNEIYGVQQYRDFEMIEEYDCDNGHKYTLIGTWGRMVGESPYYTYLYEMRNDMALLKKMIGKTAVVDSSALIRFFRPVRIK
jgi:uncharacterized protein YegP (UPF0339 family)